MHLNDNFFHATPERLLKAQQNVVRARHFLAVAAVTSSQPTQTNETFAEKLSKATKALAARRPETVKQHNERAEKERARYRKLTRRPHTKSE